VLSFRLLLLLGQKLGATRQLLDKLPRPAVQRVTQLDTGLDSSKGIWCQKTEKIKSCGRGSSVGHHALGPEYSLGWHHGGKEDGSKTADFGRIDRY
jgi:hypothetical protein